MANCRQPRLGQNLRCGIPRFSTFTEVPALDHRCEAESERVRDCECWWPGRTVAPTFRCDTDGPPDSTLYGRPSNPPRLLTDSTPMTYSSPSHHPSFPAHT